MESRSNGKLKCQSAGEAETSSSIDIDPGRRKLNIGSGLGNKTRVEINSASCALGNLG